MIASSIERQHEFMRCAGDDDDDLSLLIAKRLNGIYYANRSSAVNRRSINIIADPGVQWFL